MKTRLLFISVILAFIAVRATAAANITETGTPTIASTTYGTAGANGTFTVSGSGLSAGITVSSSVAGLQVSTNASSGFATSIVVGAAPTVTTTTIYVRISATANQTYYTAATISCSSSGATTRTINTSYVVNTAPLTLTANVPAKVYGNTLPTGAGSTYFTASGLQNGETVSSVSISYAYPNPNNSTAAVGTYSNNATISNATGGGTFTTNNYNITYVTGNVTVVAKALTLSPAAATNKSYDGTTTATITGTLNGVISPDVVTLNGTGTFASANVGTGIAVTSTSTLGGANASNYTLTQPTGLTANITTASLTITANNVTKTYGNTIVGSSGSSAFTTSGLQNGETVGTVTITYGTGASSTAAATVYSGSVTPSAAIGGTFNAANYTITYASGNIINTPKVLTVTSAAASNKVYDGTTAATITGTLTGIINSDVVTLVGTGTFANANVANGIAVTAACTLSGSGEGNYTLTQPTVAAANITKATLTITATGPQYDATQTMAAGTSTINFTYSGAVNGEVVSGVTLTPSPTGNKPAGTSYTVTPSLPTGSGAFSTNNYTVNPVAYSGIVGYSYTWTGSSGVNWSSSGNWTGGASGGVPGLHDNVTIPATINKPTIDVASACGTMNITGTTTLTLSAALTASGALTIGGNNFTFTVASTGTSYVATFAGITDIGFQSSMAINTNAIVTFSKNATINHTNSQNSITNNGTLNFSANDKINLGFSCPIINNGTLTATSSTFSLSGSGTPSYISNTGTYTDNGSTYNITGQGDYIQNTGASASMHFTGSTITYSTANNAHSLSNSLGLLTADGGTVITMGTQSAQISNTGKFNAGTSNSPCVITISGQGANINNTSTFNLGSTSIITVNGYTATVTNTSPGVFTLESDQYGSASFGQTAANATISGSYNVQRYIKGGNNLTYRGYRLLSSPVNLTSTAGGGNITLAYINTNASIVNANAIPGTTTMYGALTGGPSGSTNGFTTNGSYGNPTIYLYNEGITTNTTTSFTSGKTIGVTKITAGSSSISTLTGSTAGSTTVSVGNGFFIYFIGNNQASVYTTAHLPEDTYITATGDINQQNVPVTIWWSGSTYLSDASSNSPKGYNLVGNPYPSTIDLNVLYTDNSSTFHNFAELNDVTGAYVYWDASTSTTSGSDASEYIASGQGFFVQATGTSQTLTFKEGEKVYNPLLLNNVGTSPTPGLLSLRTSPDKAAGLALKPASITVPADFARMHVKLQKDSLTYDECAILFGSKWSDKFDDDDAYELQGSSRSFIASFSADGIRTSINKLGDYTKGKRVALYVKGLSDGLYTLTLTDITNVDTSLFNVYLIDNNKKDSLDMVRYKTYSFNLTAADTAAIHNRFAIVIEQKPLPPYALLSFTGQNGTGGVQLTWKTANEGDFTGFGLQKLNASKQYALIDSVQSNGGGFYNYIDQNPINGNNVYRLEQNDINGKLTYSAPITINYNNLQASGVFTIYPNPAKELVTFTVNSSTVTTPSYTANIYNTSGALMGRRVVNTNTWSQDVTSYKPGVYIIELKASTGDMVGQSKFVKTN